MRKLMLFVISVGLLSFASAAVADQFRASPLIGDDPVADQFRASPLSGDEEVPARDTNARGNAIFALSADGKSLSYRLIVANIDNVFASHIHMAPVGVNGGIVAVLFGPVAPGGGPSNGVLAEGTITAADLVGALSGQPLSALIDQIRAGNTYVNVHTNDGVAPPNTGPGDFPGGEVRGQIR